MIKTQTPQSLGLSLCLTYFDLRPYNDIGRAESHRFRRRHMESISKTLHGITSDIRHNARIKTTGCVHDDTRPQMPRAGLQLEDAHPVN